MAGLRGRFLRNTNSQSMPRLGLRDVGETMGECVAVVVDVTGRGYVRRGRRRDLEDPLVRRRRRPNRVGGALLRMEGVRFEVMDAGLARF